MTEIHRTPYTVIGLLLFCGFLYFWPIRSLPFYSYEAEDAVTVWEIVHGGGWILPLRNGTEIPLKPPLFPWLGALLACLYGEVNEAVVRCPSVLFATGTVVLTFCFGQALWCWRVGVLAALILATAPEWVHWAGNARSDMVLVFFLTTAGMTFFYWWQDHARRRLSLSIVYGSIGLATLAKGPLGCVLPGLVGICFLGITRNLSLLRRMRLSEGTFLVFLLAGSWYLLALWQGGWEVFHRQILDENVFRFFPTEQSGPSRGHAFYYYAPTLCAALFPWSLFFPAVGQWLWRCHIPPRDTT